LEQIPTTSDEPGFLKAMLTRSMGALLRGLAGAAALLLLLISTARAYPEQPPAGHTGGFGEPTCHRCHFDQPLNDPGGALTVDGIPKRYTPGERYFITVHLKRPDMGVGGFQLASRFKDGERAGHQAGSLQAVDGRVEVTREDSSGVQYAQQTKAGTSLVLPNTATWTVAWVAPTTMRGTVMFHLVANAGNDNASQFGDYIYVREFLSPPGETPK